MRIPPSHRGVSVRSAVIVGLMVFIVPAVASQTVTQIIDADGDGDPLHPLDYPAGIAVDSAGTVCVGGRDSNNAFRVTAGGAIEQIIDSTGDGGFYGLSATRWVAVDASGNCYLTGGSSNSAFKIDPGGAIKEIINLDGDGFYILEYPIGIAVGPTGNVYVAGYDSHNAFRITPGGVIAQIIDSSGDGSNSLLGARGIAVDGSGNVLVTGDNTDNVFRIAASSTCSTSGTPCTITEIMDHTGGLDRPTGIAVDGSGNVYVTGYNSDNAFRIHVPTTCSTGGTPCTITEIIDASGAGGGMALDGPLRIAVSPSGRVYVTGNVTDNLFEIMPDGSITEIMDVSGGGAGTLGRPTDVTVGHSGHVYVAGSYSDNAFRIRDALIFADGFESGGSSVWSNTVP